MNKNSHVLGGSLEQERGGFLDSIFIRWPTLAIERNLWHSLSSVKASESSRESIGRVSWAL